MEVSRGIQGDEALLGFGTHEKSTVIISEGVVPNVLLEGEKEKNLVEEWPFEVGD